MMTVRDMHEGDPVPLAAEFEAQGWRKPASQFNRYLNEGLSGVRSVLVAEVDGRLAGYLTVMWRSDYPPFLENNIPELVDFNVLIRYQRQGVGTALMDAAEARIAERSDTAGIGVGLMHDYGNAQILYVRRGYVPDGRGIYGHGRWINDGDVLTIGHDVALYFTKALI